MAGPIGPEEMQRLAEITRRLQDQGIMGGGSPAGTPASGGGLMAGLRSAGGRVRQGLGNAALRRRAAAAETATASQPGPGPSPGPTPQPAGLDAGRRPPAVDLDTLKPKTREERSLVKSIRETERQTGEWETAHLRQAERDASRFNANADQLEAEAARAREAGDTDLADSYDEQAKKFRNRADRQIETARRDVDKAKRLNAAPDRAELARLVDDRVARSAARRARLTNALRRARRNAVRGGVGAVVGLGGLATALALDSYVEKQAAADGDDATDQQKRVGEITSRALRGEELESDEIELLREELGPERFEGLMELGRAAAEDGADLTNDEDVREEIEAEQEADRETRNMGYDPEIVREEARRVIESPERPPFMSAAASGFNPAVYQAYVDAGRDDEAEAYQTAAIEDMSADLDAGYGDARSEFLDRLGMGETADRLDAGGPVIDPESMIGRANEAVQGANPMTRIDDMDLDVPEQFLRPVYPIPARGMWDTVFGMADVSAVADAGENMVGDMWKLGEVSGFNDGVRPITDELMGDGAAAGVPAQYPDDRFAYGDQGRVDADMDAFNREQPRSGTGTGTGGLTFDDLKRYEQMGVLGYPSAEDAARDMGIAIPRPDDPITQPRVPVGMGNDLLPPVSRAAPTVGQSGPPLLPVGGPGDYPSAPQGNPARRRMDGGLSAPSLTEMSPGADRAPRGPDQPAQPRIIDLPAGINAAPDMGRSPDLEDPDPEPGDLGEGLQGTPEERRAAGGISEPDLEEVRQALIEGDETRRPRGQRPVQDDMDEGEGEAVAPPAVAPPPSINPQGQSRVGAGNGVAGDFNQSRGKSPAGLAEGAQDAERELNWINRMMRDNLGLDAGQRASAAEALIRAGATMANTPGTFAQGLTAGAGAGLEGFQDSEDRQMEAEQLEWERGMEEAEARREAALNDLRAQAIRAKIARSSGESGIEYERKIREIMQLTDLLVANGMPRDEAFEKAQESVYKPDATRMLWESLGVNQ